MPGTKAPAKSKPIFGRLARVPAWPALTPPAKRPKWPKILVRCTIGCTVHGACIFLHFMNFRNKPVSVYYMGYIIDYSLIAEMLFEMKAHECLLDNMWFKTFKKAEQRVRELISKDGIIG